MATTKTNSKGYTSPFAIHPGETLKEALDFAEMSQTDFASRVELSEKTVSQILNGIHPITPESALKFERVLGLSDKMLLQMQAYYDADKFRLAEEERLREETKLLPKYSFYSELVKYGFVEETKDKVKRVEELLRFFGVNSLTSVRTVFPVAYRHSAVVEKMSEEATAAWLRMGVVQSQNVEVKEFNRQKLLANIPKMRGLTRRSANTYSQELVDLCGEAGVVLVYTPHLKKTCINGAVQWLSPTKVLVQVSLYHSYADIFWFSLFHELGHILKHSKKEIFVEFEKRNHKADYEKEADLFAQRILIPASKEADYELLKKSLNKLNVVSKIKDFSELVDIDPGIIAGRIGRELKAWKYVSSLRKRLIFTKD